MTVLVTGATGQVGRHVVRGLLDGGERVRALTRSPGQADLPEGAEVVAGDLARPETLAGALAGVERMYLFPVPETAAEVLALARSAGVRRVVVLSSSSAEGGDEHDFSYAMHRPVERAAEESGLEWVHVRGGEFMANTLAWWAPAVREEGVVREIHGDVPHAPVHERDIADVAVAALRPGGPAGVAYTVHGPEPVTPSGRPSSSARSWAARSASRS
ncbi:SDR family oxidoreductase [Thermocatellispora tengchongensis]|uniref:SDR family oxidoreductase n=1 Tax=Thermocatellispora tengchongensis TaxID=1073253 RepID=UPI003642CB3C